MIVGLTYDLRTDYLARGFRDEDVAEFDSEETVAAIEQAVQQLGHQTERIGSAGALCSHLVAGKKWDLVFNIAEGLSGRWRESQVPCLLEIYNINYTFSDPLACAITLDKALAKRIVRDSGILTAKFEIVENLDDAGNVTLDYPLFAKPVAEGTGKGISLQSLIESSSQMKEICKYLLERFAQPVLVEEFLPGREFTVGVLGNGDNASVLGIMEIEVLQKTDSNIYSYAAKEKCEKLVNYLPYKHGSLYAQLEQIVLKAYRILNCRDAARIDIRCNKSGIPCFLEINPLPGLHPTHSDLPMIATQQGMCYSELIDTIIKNAVERFNGVNKPVCGKMF
jgi:D-alanine-D-alanine ligase